MKSAIKKIINRFRSQEKRYLSFCFNYDKSKYEKYSSTIIQNAFSIQTEIRILVHTIEKGLSLTNKRKDFGKDKIINLISLLSEYEKDIKKDANTIHMAKSIVHEYYRYRKLENLDTSFIPSKYSSFNKECAGVTVFEPDFDLFKEFTSIALLRHSIREFSSKPIDKRDIEEAVKIAQTAPSACNRQATTVYACLDSEKISVIKNTHGGIRAFSNPTLILAITQNLGMYMNAYERNTWLVDGGIFCMNLLYSLMTVNIGACPIIWGGMPDEDIRMQDLLGITKNERIVVLIVGGYFPSLKINVPLSSKRQINDVLKFIC